LPNIIKPVAICAALLVLQACGGSSDQLTETPDDGLSQDDDGLSQEEVSFFKSVLTDLYNEEQKSLSYVDEIEALVNDIDNLQAVPASGAFDMNGAFVIPDVGDDAQDSVVGLIDLAVSIDDGTFGGSAYNFVQVNPSLDSPVDTFTGTLAINGGATKDMTTGTAVGTVIADQTQESFNLNFVLLGEFHRTQDDSIALVGMGEDINADLNAEFIAVEY